jgi:hypothetical protein
MASSDEYPMTSDLAADGLAEMLQARRTPLDPLNAVWVLRNATGVIVAAAAHEPLSHHAGAIRAVAVAKADGFLAPGLVTRFCAAIERDSNRQYTFRISDMRLALEPLEREVATGAKVLARP